MVRRTFSLRPLLLIAAVLALSLAAARPASAVPPNPIRLNVIGFVVDGNTGLGISGVTLTTNVPADPFGEGGHVSSVTESDGRFFFQKLALAGTTFSIEVTDAAGYDITAAFFTTLVPTEYFATIHPSFVLYPVDPL